MASKVKDERYFIRWTLAQRIQHWLLITSFMTLVITGLPVLFPGAKPSEIAINAMGGITARAYIHRGAAIMMILLCIFHAGYVTLSRRGRQEIKALMPTPKDLFDNINMMRFYLGMTKRKPKFDRYNFIEKFEYLALAWGSIVMIATGAILWFEEQSMTVLPKWALDVADIVHRYEAILAFLAIIIWHFYHVHLNPEVFPMSRIWLDGKISETELKHHHPLEYERILAEEAGSGTVAEPGTETEKEAVPTVSSEAKDKEESTEVVV